MGAQWAAPEIDRVGGFHPLDYGVMRHEITADLSRTVRNPLWKFFGGRCKQKPWRFHGIRGQNENLADGRIGRPIAPSKLNRVHAAGIIHVDAIDAASIEDTSAHSFRLLDVDDGSVLRAGRTDRQTSSESVALGPAVVRHAVARTGLRDHLNTDAAKFFFDDFLPIDRRHFGQWQYGRARRPSVSVRSAGRTQLAFNHGIVGFQLLVVDGPIDAYAICGFHP